MDFLSVKTKSSDLSKFSTTPTMFLVTLDTIAAKGTNFFSRWSAKKLGILYSEKVSRWTTVSELSPRTQG